jgi:ABC-type multidrug transport system ATPase subunit
VAGSQVIKVGFDENQVNLDPFRKIAGIDDIVFENGLYHFSYQNDEDIRKHIFKTAVAQNYTIIEMKQDKANFEDIFRKLTKKPEHA